MILKAMIAACLIFAAAEMQGEVYTPRPHPVIPELVLGDGRVLKDAKILSDTAYTVSVACGGKILPIDKRLLPPELLALWPADEVRGEQEREKETAVSKTDAERKRVEAAKQQAAASKYALMSKAAEEEQKKKNAAYAAKTEAEYQARENAFNAERAAIEQSRGGLLLNGAASSYGNLYVLVSNVTDGTLTFDWAALRVTPRTYSGEHQLGGIIVMDGQTENCDVPAKRARVFHLKLTSQMESKSLRWVDRPEVYLVKQLYRQRGSWDMRDQYQMERLHPQPRDDEVIQILLRATIPFVVAPLRAKS